MDNLTRLSHHSAVMHFQMLAKTPAAKIIEGERQLAAAMISLALADALTATPASLRAIKERRLAEAAVDWLMSERGINDKRPCPRKPCLVSSCIGPGNSLLPCRAYSEGHFCPRLTFLECADLLEINPGAVRLFLREQLRQRGVVIE